MRIKLSLFFFFIFPLFSQAQINFEEHLISDYSHLLGNETSVALADLDGDGDKDFLYNFGWYENLNGSNDFGPFQQVVFEYGAVYAHASDIDQDGDMDILVGLSFPENKIIMYKNVDGAGTFGAMEIIVPNVEDIKMIHTDDLDGDGDQDLLSVSDEDKVAWHENTDGQGTFGTEQIIRMTQDATWVSSQDLDGDGDRDIITTSYAHNLVVWHENLDGLGDFGTEQVIDFSGEGANMAIAKDIDSDGDQDIIAAIADPNPYDVEEITWYENDGQGGFYASEHSITDEVDDPKAVYVHDVDNDGDLDVLSASAGDHKIAWYENTNGYGNFGPQQVVTIYAYGANFVVTFDNDADADKDIVAGSALDSKRTWYENLDGFGSFGTENIIDISTGPYTARWVRSADMDGDGDKDVLYAAYDDNRISWHENTDGQGAFAPEKLISTFVNKPTSVHPADLDGDNDMDVLSSSYSDHKIAWYENQGQGTFGLQQVISTNAAFAKSVFASDLDGDGDMDALSASRGDDKIAWYENTDGQGTFGPEQIISDTSIDANAVFAIDIDNDGDKDVLTASLTDDIIAWHENTNGQGSFGPRQIVTNSADFAVSVYATDLDGDGDEDILSASSGDHKIAWYENQGQGNFGPQNIITTSEAAAYSVYAADLDNDGDQDVLCANWNYPSRITWFENTDGSGSFGPAQLISTNVNGASCVYADDLDADGDMDVLSSSYNIQGRITWYKNPTNFSITKNTLDSFSVYPNPTTGILQINSEIPIKKIEVINSLGQYIFSTDQNQIDISKLSNGIYFLKITGQNGNSETKKIVKK